MALATVSVSLFSIAVMSVYFVKAPVMHKMYLCWHLVASMGPKRSAWMRMLGWSGISSGCNDGGLSVDDYLLWQLRQVFMYWRMFE
jgi:hypothetical protein